MLILSIYLNQKSSKYFLRKTHSKFRRHFRFLTFFTDNAKQTVQLYALFSGLWIRIRIGSGFNGVPGSGFGIRIRIQGQEKEENEEKILTFILKFLQLFRLNFPLAAHINTVYFPIFFQCCRAASF
jgi:hypothetical protein